MEWYTDLVLALVLGGAFWVWRTLLCSKEVSCVGCGRCIAEGACVLERRTEENRRGTVLTNGEKRI